MMIRFYKCLLKNGVNYITKDSECWGHSAKPYQIQHGFWNSKGKQYDMRLLSDLFPDGLSDVNEMLSNEEKEHEFKK